MAGAVAASVKPVERNGAQDVGFAVGIVFILTVLFLPLPAVLIDIGLAFSIALVGADPDGGAVDPEAARLLGLPDRAADRHAAAAGAQHRHHAAHPVRTAREGYAAAGHVIAGFANFVMSGDFVIGTIVFVILITVNFLVITKGATRIAEVGARFTLDAIPGKQMAIDADLYAGLIDEKEATRRRRELEEESAFFGAMDGASKFVRGDAIAGIIITAVNVFGGIVIGVTRHGMSPAEAADVFTKLSVGDGLVTQIPALIVSLAAGLLVSKGGTRGSAEKAMFGQLGNYPRALLLAGVRHVRAGAGAGPAASARSRCSARVHGLRRLRHSQRRGGGAGGRGGQGARGRRWRPRRRRANPSRNSLKTAEIELCLGKQLSTALLHVARRAGPARRQDAPQIRQAVRLRRPGDQAHRRSRHPAQDLPDQDPRHGRRQRGAAHRRRAGHHRRRAAARTCPATRRASRPSA